MLYSANFSYRYILYFCLGWLVQSFFFFTPVQAQHKQLKFKKTDQKQGLSSNKVHAVLRDSKGFMWFGTKEGLNLYDGYNFTVFQQNDSIGLTSSHIQALYEDSDGNIWIGTYDGGISIYDRYTQSFHSFKNDPKDEKSLSSNNVFVIYEDHNQNVWIGTYGGGLCKYNKKDQNFTVFKHLSDDPNSLSNNAVFDIYEDTEGILWLATFGGGLSAYHPDHNVFTNYPSTPANDLFTICGDHLGNIWMGSYGDGLIKFNTEENKFTSYQYNSHDNNTIRSNFVVSLETDHQGNLWIATREGGLNYLEIKSEKFHTFNGGFGEEYTLHSHNVNTLFIDEEGILWIGTEGDGIYRTFAFAAGFNNFSGEGIVTPGFEAKSVTALFEDSHNNIWVGTFGEGLYKIAQNRIDITHYTQDFFENSIAENFITDIVEDKNHTIWIGTLTSGLTRLNPQSQRFTTYQNQTVAKNSLSNNAINTLHVDKKGDLWIGTDGGGLCQFDESTSSFTTFTQDPYHPKTSLVGNSVKVIYEDEQSLWLGTKESGISRLDLNTLEFSNFRNTDGAKNILPSNEITSIAKDKNDVLWIGTFDQGIGRIDVKDNTYHILTTEDGLISNNICYIQSGHDSTLWISTVEGLCRLNPASMALQNFTVNEGLYNQEFIQWSGCKNDKGELYFGHLGGFIHFNPESFPDVVYPFPVYTTAFMLFDEKQTLTSPYFALDSIALNYDDNFFEFEYAFLNYLNPQDIQYAYMMENLDQDWKYVGSRRVASYTNLDAGVYHFKVKASTQQGAWYEIAKPVTIVIHPAWYNTWWFRILTTFLVIGCCFGYYLYNINAVKRKNRQLEGMVAQRTSELVEKNEEISIQKESIEAKNRLMIEAKALIEERNLELRIINEELEDRVAQRTKELQTANEQLKKANGELDTFIYRSYHDIIGPLSRIHGLCQVALLDVQEAKAIDYILKLNDSCESAKDTLHRVLRIHDIRNHKLDFTELDILALVHEITASFEERSKQIQVTISCENNFGTPLIKSDNELLSIILYNLIENAVKYSFFEQDSYIQIRLSNMPKGFVKVSISDNGIGIQEEVRHKVFTMFFRAAPDLSGVGLGLYHAKVAIQRLGGEIKYSHNGSETNFEFQIPGKEIEEKVLKQPLENTKS